MQGFISQLVFGISWKALEVLEQKSSMIQATFLKDHSGIGGGKRSSGTQDWKDRDQPRDYCYSLGK